MLGLKQQSQVRVKCEKLLKAMVTNASAAMLAEFRCHSAITSGLWEKNNSY